ncbi:MAG: hypothetical protein UW03_C0007G0028 [Candidatus Peregrinibacteria bacterium GW2011_GWA2_43_8]|nr:MAG: hypothetical protein UW03_C0007G0028 [Candidatus Peregrinibacteria bacterium GW2011_GWA2_43_8]
MHIKMLAIVIGIAIGKSGIAINEAENRFGLVSGTACASTMIPTVLTSSEKVIS